MISMFRIIIIIIFAILYTSQFVIAQSNSAQTFTVIPRTGYAPDISQVKIDFIRDNIVRITNVPKEPLPPGHDLVTVYTPQPVVVKIAETDSIAEYSTDAIKVVVNKFSGAVSFYGPQGKLLTREPSYGGKNIRPAFHSGEKLYHVNQSFVVDPSEVLAGLGQFQEDAWNYNNRQVTFFQNNTQVAVPFLVSDKKYGILWNNYSFTRAGNTQAPLPLSALILKDKNGNEGWLSARFSNNRAEPNISVLDTPYSTISFPYVNDSKTFLPKAFRPEAGVVTYEGSVGTYVPGKQTLKVYYAGYVKIWLDGKLVFDKWRQAWNPGSGVVEADLQTGQQYPLKIEWIPDGGESYLDISYLPPLTGEKANTFSFDSEAARNIDYFFVAGQSIDEVISGYRQLTGKAPIMPKWAMGFWQSRERYKTQQELLDVVSTFRKRKIPLDNIVLDWFYWKEHDWGSQQFDSSRFPDPKGMISKLHKEYKTQLMISVWPKFHQSSSTYKQFNDSGYLYKRNIADRQKDWVGPGYTSTFYDAFNPHARDAFWKLIYSRIYKLGIDAWWMDASEPDILSNTSPERRKLQMSPTYLGTAAEYLNAYPLQNAKGIYDGQRSADPDRRVFLLTRSGFAGSQRYAAAIWSGDIASRWEDMKAQISAGINFSLTGIPYWTMDIGGFSVERRYETPNATDKKEWEELQTRWFQFGAFVPLFRVHGQYPFREIYNTTTEGSPAWNSMMYYNKLRYKLMPYIYSLSGNVYHQNSNIMRSLLQEFTTDKKAVGIGDQFMFGPSLLINPVYEYGATSRKVYLPAGQGWYHIYNGKYIEGGQEIDADAPYEKMPVFVKAGSIIPTGPEIQYVAEKPADPLTLYVYTGKDARFDLYEDDGATYKYEKGQFSQIPIQWNEITHTLTIGNRKGGYKEMLKSRTFKFVVITPDSPLGIDEVKAQKEVRYSGKLIQVKF